MLSTLPLWPPEADGLEPEGPSGRGTEKKKVLKKRVVIAMASEEWHMFGKDLLCKCEDVEGRPGLNEGPSSSPFIHHVSTL